MANTNANAPPSSTLHSYIDSAANAVHSVVDSFTAKPSQETVSQAKREDPDRAQGRWEQTVGSATEAVGGLVGSENLRQQGAEKRAAGEEREARGQVRDMGAGLLDRMEGRVKSAVADATGDHEAREHWEAVHAQGTAKQRGVEAELQARAGPQE